MKLEAYAFADSENLQDAKRCYDACLYGLTTSEQHLVLHYSTHTDIKKVAPTVARQRFLEAVDRDCSRLEYMTKLKQYCHALELVL